MTDARRPSLPPGHSEAFPRHLPKPTAAPVTFAFAVTLVAWSFISSSLLGLIGGALLLYALLHWVAEIWHDAK